MEWQQNKMMLLTQVGRSEKSMKTFRVSLGLLVIDLSRRTVATFSSTEMLQKQGMQHIKPESSISTEDKIG